MISYPSSYGGGGEKLKFIISGTFDVVVQSCNDVSKVHQKNEVRILLVLEERGKHLAGKNS